MNSKTKGALFTAPLYQETDVNALIATRLHDLVDDPTSSLDLRGGVEGAFAIAESARRLQSVPAWQRLWHDGCAAGGVEELALQCRASAYLLGLQYRLSGFHGFERTGGRYQRDVAPVVLHEQRRRWPDGMQIAGSVIPDREPLRKPILRDTAVSVLTARAVAALPTALDPLTSRRAAVVWPLRGQRAVGRLIEGVGRMTPLQHARRVDELLVDHPAWRSIKRSEREADCEVIIARRYAKFTCGSQRAGLAGDTGLVVSVYLDDGRVTAASVAGLEIGSEYWRSSLDLPLPKVERTLQGWKIVSRVLQPFTGLSVRRGNGVRIEQLTLKWTDGGASETSGPPSSARATLLLVDDFELVRQAVERLEQQGRAGEHGLFARGAFRPARLTVRLMALLGESVDDTWLRDARRLPPIALEADTTLPDDTLDSVLLADVPIADFAALCSDCHAGPNEYPPNFLYGEPETVLGNLSVCSQRIWMRLRMWGFAPAQRPKSPMPPVGSMSWLASADTAKQLEALDSLERFTEALVRKQLAPNEEPHDLFAAGYQNAMQCRPSS